MLEVRVIIVDFVSTRKEKTNKQTRQKISNQVRNEERKRKIKSKIITNEKKKEMDTIYSNNQSQRSKKKEEKNIENYLLK